MCSPFPDLLTLLQLTVSNDDRKDLFTLVEMRAYWLHSVNSALGMRHIECVHYVEEMLRKQLVAALGKEVSLSPFLLLHRYLSTNSSPSSR